jgi:hypothetical protein
MPDLARGPFPKLKTWFECVEERDAEIARLRTALVEIYDRHLGDCPAGIEELQQAKGHIFELRKIAYKALKEPNG